MINDLVSFDLADKSKALYDQLDHLSGGTLRVLVRAIQRFGEVYATEAAAGIAYYTLFSIFPLLLVLVALGSFVLESQQVQQQVLGFVSETIPGAQGLINQNIQRVLDLRGPVGIIGIVGLLWSATTVFNTMARHVNLAWMKSDTRSFLARRLVALGIVGSLVVLLILSVTSTALLDFLADFNIPLAGISLSETPFWGLGLGTLPIFLRLLLFLGLYRWVPNTDVRWMEAFWGAVVAALGWELTTSAFTWYLSSGLASYELVYGSLGTVVALMFWLYLSSIITLFGAHLSAALRRV